MSATAGQLIDMGTFKIPASVEIRDEGRTKKIKDTRGLFVLHAALLYTGKVLLFCGHAEFAHYATVSYVFDPADPNLPMKPQPFPGSMDLFCCHYVTLPDGRLLVIGGSLDFHKHSNRSFGAKNVCFFVPDRKQGGTGKWEPAQRGSARLTLNQGRWYPTLILTGDGEVLVFSGRTGRDETTHPFRIADSVEMITFSKPGTRNVKISKVDVVDSANKSLPLLPIYPGMHMVKNGKIFFTATTWGQEIPNPPTLSIDWTGSTKTWTNHNKQPAKFRREEGMSVPLPPAQDGKILLIGGSRAVNQQNFSIYAANNNPALRGNAAYRRIFDATDPTSAEVLETSPVPAWKTLPDLKKPRITATCVILPDSSVLILGGHGGFKWTSKTSRIAPTQPSMECEIFDGSNFKLMASLHHPRMYHSIALLLPDGSVMAAGGADPNENEPKLNYPTGWNGPVYGYFVEGNKMFPLFRDPVTDYIFFKDELGQTNLARLVTNPDLTESWETVEIDPLTNAPITFDGNGNPIVRNPFPPPTNVPVVAATGVPASIPLNRKDFEIYKPTYFFKTPRPKIKGVRKNGAKSKQMNYGEEFTIQTDQASSITKSALMRLGCITHHTDSEQRYIKLTIKSKTADAVTVTMPAVADKNIATPGYYMLWIIDDKNIPCEKAEIVQLTTPPKTKP